MGRLSAVAGAGAAAWVVPEILTAKPAAGAALSGGPGVSGGASGSVGVSTSASMGGDPGTSASAGATGTLDADTDPAGVSTSAHTTAAVDPSGSLAFTGLNIQRDASVGAALVAGGWALQHWASRSAPHRPTPADGTA